jgi:hypothetical protein
MAKQNAPKEDGSSLERAQYEYRKMIYFEGLKILETFSESVIGRDPSSGGGRMYMESGGGASSGAHANGPPPGGHIYGSPPIPWGAPPGVHIYICGPPAGTHIYGSPPPCCGYGPVTDGPPPGGHIYAIIKLVESVLCLKPHKPPK